MQSDGIFGSSPDRIRYGRELADYRTAMEREYLMTDGACYSSSSFAGNTRRYHGLFVYRRQVLLSTLHEEINGVRLFPGHWGDTFLGQGMKYTIGAEIYPVRQMYALPGAYVTRTIILQNGVTIRYDILGEAEIMIRPLFTNRDIHDLCFDPCIIHEESESDLRVNNCLVSSNLSYHPDHQVYRNAWYPEERKRGYDDHEDLVSPGYFSLIIRDGSAFVSVSPPGQVMTPDPGPDNSLSILDRAGRLCLSEDGIYAGYHWFQESWGRDTFISLPGLLLESGKFTEAEDIFRWYLDHQKNGLIPNRSPDLYTSSDASLWLFWAVFQYMQKKPSSPFLREIRPGLESLITRYPESDLASLDNFQVHVEPHSTWMDTIHTPRGGKPVEVNALWILALEVAEFMGIEPPVRSVDAHRAFSSFWNTREGCLYDLRDPDDPAIRPNQIIALAFGLVPFDEGRMALERITTDLITPYGPRTLAPGSSGYFGSFHGDVSYHNGMVWPWLNGFYIDALMRYGEPYKLAASHLLPLWEHLHTDGAGMLPELFTGDAPYHPSGTICQAWSIAELIRARNRIMELRDQYPSG